jgi:hypothetical protein
MVKEKPGKKPAGSKHDLLLDPDDGGNIFFLNFS